MPDAIADLERFLHSDDPLPLLVRIGLAHAQFGTIHPFLDGNGRIGRLLIVFLLCEKGALSQPVLYISHFFRRHRQRYYESLQATRTAGDWEGWLEFFLEAVGETAAEALESVRRVLDMRERHRQLVVERFGRVAGNALAVLEDLYRNPFVSVNEVAEKLSVSFTAANALVARMVRHGLVSEMTGQSRHRVFGYGDYIGLFRE